MVQWTWILATKPDSLSSSSRTHRVKKVPQAVRKEVSTVKFCIPSFESWKGVDLNYFNQLSINPVMQWSIP